MNRVNYRRLEHLYDTSWLGQGWRGRVKRYAPTLVTAFTTLRMISSVLGPLLGSNYFDDPLIEFYEQIKMKTPLKLAFIGLGMFSTIIEYLLSSTVHKPCVTWTMVRDQIFNLEKNYLRNYSKLVEKAIPNVKDNVHEMAMHTTASQYRSTYLSIFGFRSHYRTLKTICRLETWASVVHTMLGEFALGSAAFVFHKVKLFFAKSRSFRLKL